MQSEWVLSNTQQIIVFRQKTNMISKNKIKLIHSLEHKKFRKETGLFVAEGRKIISDLKKNFELVDFFEGEDAEKASLLDTPANQLALFKCKQHTIKEIDQSALTLFLDGIQNPGNLGTIIRLADWFGIEDIYCSDKCADIYNPKVVQATMGSLGHVNVYYANLKELLQTLPENFPIYGTFLEGENIYDKELTKNGVVIMGNEGHGISDEIKSMVNSKLFIPNYPQDRQLCESLNVAIATAIICSEFRRR